MALFSHLPSTGPLVTLRDGEAELVVAPECGARIAAFRIAGRDVLRPASPESLATAFIYGFAAFPLMPYSGPIFGDGFRYRGTFHPLARNVPAEPTATHGEGWISRWTITDRSANAVRLAFDCMPDGAAFPFAWRGEIAYRIEKDAFAIDLKLFNRDTRPMPAGLGFHPYFPKAPGTCLAFACTGVWPPDAPEAVSHAAGPVEPGLDFAKGEDVSGLVLDRCYEGWDGVATLSHADGSKVSIEADAIFGKLQVYDAWDYPYICIEPVTNANDGFNRAARGVAGHAVVDLAPGESMGGRIVISAR